MSASKARWQVLGQQAIKPIASKCLPWRCAIGVIWKSSQATRHHAWTKGLRDRNGQQVGVEFATASVSSPHSAQPPVLPLSVVFAPWGSGADKL